MLYAIVAVIALILDQGIKYWATVNIVVDTGEAKLIPGLVHLANVHNTGAAFSFLEGARWFFVILCIVFVLVVIYALSRDLITGKVCRWAAVFVMAGAIGNCIDRIVCGYVVDMFEFDFLIFKRPFPVFNLADVFITVGVIVFCVALLSARSSGKKPAKAGGRHAGGADAAEETSVEAPVRRAAIKKPVIRRRPKTEIPDFPKHELPDVPPLDPNDPFAEWEKRANAAKDASAPGKTVYTQPAAAEAQQFRIDAVPPDPAPAAAEAPNPVEPAAPASPARAEVPAAAEPSPAVPDPKPAPAPNSAPAAEESFDLESILAEFKDL